MNPDTTLATRPALSSRSVLLRPLLPSDGEWCYALMCGPAGMRWKYRGRTPSPEVVANDLWRGVFAQFVVTDRGTQQPVGLVGFYNVATDAGRAHAFAIAEPDSGPLATEGFGLLCAWGFAEMGFQRIFIEAAEFNIAAFASLGDTAVIEGRLRNYELWRGRFWDLFIMSIGAEAFEQRFGQRLSERQHPPQPRPGSGEAELVELIAELWPLDSLGRVEVLSALEDLTCQAVESSILSGIDAADPVGFARQLLASVDH